MARLQARDERNFTGSLPDLKASLKATEQQTKVVDQNITTVETHFPKLSTVLQRYAVGTAKLRDKGDALHKAVATYAENESQSMKEGLNIFADCLAAVQDYRDAHVHRLEDQLVEGLVVYETKCKQARNDVKNSSSLCTKEVKSFNTLEKAQTQSGNRSRISKAQAEFQKASGEANRSLQILRQQMNEFEVQKMRDVKKIFSEFVRGEMEFCARALEVYTRAYQAIHNIDENQDLDRFNQSLLVKPPTWGSAPALSSVGRYNSTPSLENVIEEEDDLNRTL
ncbi:protein FAM92A-like [Actinia tenebrosa]|uniref:Protein FAM92A-like n=1 Tax=Actinia tenebrosa TaxID=6105 RepID=A0A6P8IBM3_ACTTE|nr:protein FAM92A-like [Actinia tenebrosa]